MKKITRFKNFKAYADKLKNIKVIQDANGEELIFPDVEFYDNPTVGERVEFEDKKQKSGEIVMPNGETFIVVNEILSEIIPKEVKREKLLKAYRTFITSSKKKIEILAANRSVLFKVGNPVKVDGQKIALGKYEIGNIKMIIKDGAIERVEAIKQTNRKLWK